MPNLDGTGPKGAGPRNGRVCGICAGHCAKCGNRLRMRNGQCADIQANKKQLEDEIEAIKAEIKKLEEQESR